MGEPSKKIRKKGKKEVQNSIVQKEFSQKLLNLPIEQSMLMSIGSDGEPSVGLKNEDELLLKARLSGPAYGKSEFLAEGGLGVVEAIKDLRTGRIVARKTPKSDDSKVIHEFVKEGELAANMAHPNILSIYEMGHNEAGQVYITMPLVKGEKGSDLNTLKAIIESNNVDIKKKYDQNRLIDIMINICNALTYVHEELGILHLDIKPENIMVGSYNQVYLMDWGLAKRIDLEDVTSVGVLGSPVFLSPEQTGQSRHCDLDVRSDIYSVGATLYNLLSHNRFSVSGKTLPKLLERINKGKLNPLPKFIPEELRAIILKAMSLQKDGRYTSIQNLEDDLVHFRRGEPIEALEYNVINRLTKWAKRNKLATMVIVIVAFTSVMITSLAIWALEEKQMAQFTLSRFKAEEIARKVAEEKEQVIKKQQKVEALRTWQPVFKDDFSDTDLKKRWILGNGNFVVKNGKLYMDGGKTRVLRLKKPYYGNLRIEFDFYQDQSRIDAVGCFINGSRHAPLDKYVGNVAFTGYLVQLAAWNNSKRFFSKGERQNYLWSESDHKIIRNKKYHVVFERINKQFMLKINDKLIFNITDPDPLNDYFRNIVGIYGSESSVVLDNFVIYQLGSALKVDLLSSAHEFLSERRYRTAIDLYYEVLNSTIDNNRLTEAEEGLFKAYRGEISQQLDYKNIDHALFLFEEFKHTFSEGKYDEKLKVLSLEIHYRKKWPFLELNFLDDETYSVSIDDNTFLKNSYFLKDVLDNLKVSEIDLSNERILAFPKAQTYYLKKLNLSNCKKMDFSFLKNIGSLTDLDLSFTQMKDLHPLETLELKSLNLSYTPVANLRYLKDMSLVDLDLSYTLVNNLEDLNVNSLRSIYLNGCQEIDLKPLQGAKLKKIELFCSQVKDILPLSQQGLESIQFTPYRLNEGWQEIIKNERSLKNIAINRFGYLERRSAGDFLEKSKAIHDLEWWEKIVERSRHREKLLYEKLEDSNEYSDSEAVINMNGGQIVGVYIHDYSNIKNIEPLKDHTSITRLYVGSPLVTDLSFASNLSKLAWLDISRTSISDISNLNPGNLVELVINPKKLKGDWLDTINKVRSLCIVATNQKEVKLKQTKLQFLENYKNGKYGVPKSSPAKSSLK